MSIPKIDLTPFLAPKAQKKKEKEKPKKYKWVYFTPLLLIPTLYIFFVRERFHHMLPLVCANRLGRYKCRLRTEGKITVISQCSSIHEFSFGNTRLPAHLFRVGADAFSFYCNAGTLTVETVAPHCKVDVYLRETDYKPNYVPSLTWVTTSNHKYFTVKAGTEVILDRIPASMLQASRLGQYIGYYTELCHPRITVEGDGQDDIFTYPC